MTVSECSYPESNSKKEGILGDAMVGDGTLFAGRAGVKAAWAVVEPVLDPFFSTTAQFARIFSTVVLSDFEIRTSDLRLRRARVLLGI